MQDRLKKIYFALLAPAVLGFVVIYLLRSLHGLQWFTDPVVAFVAPTIFILAVIFAVAGPIFYRSLFAHRWQHYLSVPPLALFRFERNQTLIAMVTPYLALVAYFMELPRFHLAGTFLLALYAVYYYYPSTLRISVEQRIFKAAEAKPLNKIIYEYRQR